MLGRTNIIANGSSGGVTTVDLPTCPASILAAGGDQSADITLSYSDTTNVSGIELRYKVGSYPSSPTDGSGKTVSGAVASVKVTGLTNGYTYCFRVFLYREVNGVKYYQTDPTRSKCSCLVQGFGVVGITPAKKGNNWLLVDKSGAFTLVDAKSIRVTLVGGGSDGQEFSGSKYDSSSYRYNGGMGGPGGYYLQETIELTGTENFTLTVGSASEFYKNYPGGATILKVDSTTYSANKTFRSGGDCGMLSATHEDDGTDCSPTPGLDGFSTVYGYVGSSGGGGAAEPSSGISGAIGGKGAGNGGGSSANLPGTDAENYGCGGGGEGVLRTGSSSSTGNSPGSGKQGCLIIEKLS